MDQQRSDERETRKVILYRSRQGRAWREGGAAGGMK